jgi:tRNA pseudouridine55 synthase
VPPRGLNPSGLILVDKPAGPTSFDVIARIRRRTGARTGHAGTLDPFATGLLLVLSGAATRLAPWLVGLDKRYVTDIDLTARTSTGDPEGEVVEKTEAPGADDLEARLAAMRGEVDLPIPAASAVKIGGERAYALHRRGQVVEMPIRRSRVDALELVSYVDGTARLDLRVGSGTYVRSIADVLGGHCRTLRRTEVGPFSVDDADEESILPPADALPFLPVVEVDEDEAAAIRAGRARAQSDVRTLLAGELVAVGKVVMPAIPPGGGMVRGRA